MTHMHVAGSIHADAVAQGPQWLVRPEDVNALDERLWSTSVVRSDEGVVTVAGLGVDQIAREVGTPVYVVDEADFRRRARGFAEAFAGWDIYYAGKSFLTSKVARWVAEEGLCLDVCSGNELTVALRGGMDPAKIGLHGNNKSVEELRLALESGVGRIIVDSLDEISRLETLATELDTTARVLVRVTTGVEAHTHEYIATAHEDQKFGFSIQGGQALMALVRCQQSPGIELRGIHSHIGSQIFDTHGFEVAARRTMRLMAQFGQATGVSLPELDLGGGFGIAYTAEDTPATPDALSAGLTEIIEHERRAYGLHQPHLSIEPGRAISGPPAMAVYTVGTVKVVDIEGGAQRVYVSVDGGMSDNIRPALYAAEYSAVVANRTSTARPVLCRVVGKHCEGGDILVRDVFLPADVRPGDLVAVPASGAYSRAMASNYNHATKPPVVSVKDGQLSTMLRRETLDDLLALDVLD
ncbi:MAG TPA: diaminopimelate decarboxylase [Propionibacteriaceae bacterium]|nr:diaminopimelate decarboxylase [Propionibacteriaceae bacterium]